MSDGELLALLIRSGDRVASELLNRHGSLRELLHADREALIAERGIGASRARIIRALPELARRYFEASLVPGEAIRSPADDL